MKYLYGFTAGLRTTSPSSGTRTGLSNTRTLPPDPLLESAGRTWWAFGIRQPDRDYPVPIVETESFLNLEPAPAVRMNQPFGLFCSAWRVLEPFRLECVRIPPVRAGKNGRIIRIVIFYVACHRFSPVARCYSAGVQPRARL